jgi:hypothetical protein
MTELSWEMHNATEARLTQGIQEARITAITGKEGKLFRVDSRLLFFAIGI